MGCSSFFGESLFLYFIFSQRHCNQHIPITTRAFNVFPIFRRMANRRMYFRYHFRWAFSFSIQNHLCHKKAFCVCLKSANTECLFYSFKKGNRIIANYCNVTLSVSDSPKELKPFAFSNMKLEAGISGVTQVFRLETLRPLSPLQRILLYLLIDFFCPVEIH